MKRKSIEELAKWNSSHLTPNKLIHNKEGSFWEKIKSYSHEKHIIRILYDPVALYPGSGT